MNDNKANANVIQFPGSKKIEAPKAHKAPLAPQAPQAPKATPPEKPARKAKAAVAGSVLAVVLFTGAVNRFAFQLKALESADLSSSSRAIASVDHTFVRDAAWEKQLAERLASANLRGPAATGIGHDANPEEKLRWGTLEEKYTILFKADAHKIDSITLQDPAANPSYVLDRRAFLKEYGTLLQEGFSSAQLNSVEVSHDKTIESYLLMDKSGKGKVQARFELDVHKRLLSLKVEPSQI